MQLCMAALRKLSDAAYTLGHCAQLHCRRQVRVEKLLKIRLLFCLIVPLCCSGSRHVAAIVASVLLPELYQQTLSMECESSQLSLTR
jgi:hypothetical protein